MPRTCGQCKWWADSKMIPARTPNDGDCMCNLPLWVWEYIGGDLIKAAGCDSRSDMAVNCDCFLERDEQDSGNDCPPNRSQA